MSDANLLDNPHMFHYQDYFVMGGIHTCLGVSVDPMFLWISLNSCPLNLLLVRSHQAEIIIVKRLIQGRNNVTRVRVEPRSFDQGCRKNDAYTHSATLPTMVIMIVFPLTSFIQWSIRQKFWCILMKNRIQIFVCISASITDLCFLFQISFLFVSLGYFTLCFLCELSIRLCF